MFNPNERSWSPLSSTIFRTNKMTGDPLWSFLIRRVTSITLSRTKRVEDFDLNSRGTREESLSIRSRS